jgi:hypothetical protein
VAMKGNATGLSLVCVHLWRTTGTAPHRYNVFHHGELACNLKLQGLPPQLTGLGSCWIEMIPRLGFR